MAYLCRRQDGKECDCCMECVGERLFIACPVCGGTDCTVFYWREEEILGCDGCIDRIPVG